jgi:capsular exopolysaccharide synthesis family protein
MQLMTYQNENISNAYIIKNFISQVLSLKYYFIISFIIFIGIAFGVNKYSPVKYEVNSVIGPIEDQRPALLGSNDLFRGLVTYEQARNTENDVNNIKSFSLVSNTLKKMNLEVGYFTRKEQLLDHEHQIYPTAPFHVSIDKSHVQPVNAKFNFDVIDENSYRITVDASEVSMYNYLDNAVLSDDNVLKYDTVCRFGETVDNRYFKFVITRNSVKPQKSGEPEPKYFFIMYNLDDLAKSYLGAIEVKPVSIRSSLINISLQGENIRLTIDFLNSYVQTFLDDNLSKKNKMSANAVSFIDAQIANTSDSLNRSESRLKDYRSANQVMDLSYQGQRAFEQMSRLEQDRSDLAVQERYYTSIIQNFEKNKDITSIPPPSAASIDDPVMNQLILDLNTMNNERAAVVGNNAEKNLFVGQIDSKIKLQKQAIIETVRNNLNTLALKKNELNYRNNKVSQEISRLPRTELNMVSMKRKFDVGDAIYTYLLQKRTEAAITMASNHSDYEIIEPARDITRKIISPKTMVNYMFALFFALLIPTGYILLKNFFNETITDVAEAEYILKKPVMSIIYSNPSKTQAVVTEHPSSPVSESFRNLRSKLFLKFKSDALKTLVITSSQPRDGKSFISYNLAASIASVGHKTIVIDCDLRRPTLHQVFKRENILGVTNYLADNVSRERIVHESDTENLHFIPAGPVLANSSEMIEAGELDSLIEWLRTKYDFIIIDSPPMGIISEATQLMKYASHILFVCRYNHTRKDVFRDMLSMFRTNNIRNFDVVFNDLNIDTSKYGHYRDYYSKKAKS